ncbi:MAG: HD domain-containing phosphohydrolase [bacterium]
MSQAIKAQNEKEGFVRAIKCFQFLGKAELKVLMKLWKFDSGTAIHSLNVALRLREMLDQIHFLPGRKTFTWNELIKKSGFSEEQLLRAALLHDIGKMRIPKAILFKGGRFTDDERAIVQTHEKHSKSMLSELGYLLEAEIVGQHHNYEKQPVMCCFYFPITGQWLGVANLLHIADTQSALMQKRSYKQGYSPMETLALISQNAIKGCACPLITAFHVRKELKKANASYGQRLESSSWKEIMNLSAINELLSAGRKLMKTVVSPIEVTNNVDLIALQYMTEKQLFSVATA